MTTTADNLRDLHSLHQRAKALRDRLASGPKTLAARQAALAKRKTELETTRENLKKLKADIKNKEVQALSMRGRSDDLRVKLNSIKKQVEYDALRNEIAHNNLAVSKLEDEIIEQMQKAETLESELQAIQADVEQKQTDTSALEREVAEQAVQCQSQLAELERSIVEAENIIPANLRDQYRRVINQRGADAMAQVEDGACLGCYVSVTSQAMNELINAESLVFCQICGRILYLADVGANNLRRVAAK